MEVTDTWQKKYVFEAAGRAADSPKFRFTTNCEVISARATASKSLI